MLIFFGGLVRYPGGSLHISAFLHLRLKFALDVAL